MKKISVLMPTYNDCDTIEYSIDSLITQTYSNWELIIIDDGSVDDTKEVIEKYKEKKDKNNQIKYIHQKNQDQLLALINGLKYVSGDYVYILHSDDLLYDENVFNKVVEYFDNHQSTDAIISNLTIIDENGKVTGEQIINPYLKKRRIPVIQLLWLGRNLYVDSGFFRSEIFKENVYRNYLTWNRPFWLDIDKEVHQVNVDNVNFNLFKYRVYEGNYANNEVGKLCLLNGELRTATELMKFYNIPLYNIQYLVYRIFCHLHLFKFYFPIYQNKEMKNKGKIVDFIIRKRYPEGYINNIFLNSLYMFYSKSVHRIVNFDQIYNGKDPIYLGNNLRRFNKELLDNKLPKLYINMFKEMQKGFDEVVVSNNNYGKAVNLIRFLCIYQFVRVRCIEDEEKNN